MLTGDNGILNKATTAKEETSKASAEEKVKVAVYGSYNTEGKIDATELKKNLNNVEGIDKTTTNIKTLPATVVCDGYEIEIVGRLEGVVIPGGYGEIASNNPASNRQYEIPSNSGVYPNYRIQSGFVCKDLNNKRISDEILKKGAVKKVPTKNE